MQDKKPDISELKDTTLEQQSYEDFGYTVIPIGVPVPWPSEIPPDGWLKCNGEVFDTVKYPKLALAYPSGRLPDLRGEFIRGWDDERGVDSDRNVLSWQEGSYLVQDVNDKTDTVVNFSLDERSALKWDTPSSNVQVRAKAVTGESWEWNTDSAHIGVTRPRNIAFNYIVRAA
ncbi:tail fiber protein [Xenorhabdus bovienii]|uniref:phage tail protein n=1 Tax=Xenorhabdus bovienii TaxID=40576 RepID=UPI0023B2220A|nr:phage tail protein [Xenorhabdus bovienii]MDE9557618.1 tail fiber protein [Xenorhabdus bovienii]MDE9566707.1 tail fiber protein [Xenorhabdus bovienii]